MLIGVVDRLIHVKLLRFCSFNPCSSVSCLGCGVANPESFSKSSSSFPEQVPLKDPPERGASWSGSFWKALSRPGFAS